MKLEMILKTMRNLTNKIIIMVMKMKSRKISIKKINLINKILKKVKLISHKLKIYKDILAKNLNQIVNKIMKSQKN